MRVQHSLCPHLLVPAKVAYPGENHTPPPPPSPRFPVSKTHKSPQFLSDFLLKRSLYRLQLIWPNLQEEAGKVHHRCHQDLAALPLPRLPMAPTDSPNVFAPYYAPSLTSASILQRKPNAAVGPTQQQRHHRPRPPPQVVTPLEVLPAPGQAEQGLGLGVVASAGQRWVQRQLSEKGLQGAFTSAPALWLCCRCCFTHSRSGSAASTSSW